MTDETAEEIVQHLAAQGVTLAVDGPTLRYSGPAGALDRARRAAIAQQRAAIMALLEGDKLLEGGAETNAHTLPPDRPATLQHSPPHAPSTPVDAPETPVAASVAVAAGALQHCKGSLASASTNPCSVAAGNKATATLAATLSGLPEVDSRACKGTETGQCCSVAGDVSSHVESGVAQDAAAAGHEAMLAVDAAAARVPDGPPTCYTFPVLDRQRRPLPPSSDWAAYERERARLHGATDLLAIMHEQGGLVAAAPAEIRVSARRPMPEPLLGRIQASACDVRDYLLCPHCQERASLCPPYGWCSPCATATWRQET